MIRAYYCFPLYASIYQALQSVGKDKSKASALTNEAFAEYIEQNGINEFYITGADATACVKSTGYNLVKAGYKVHVISDYVTSYDLKKMDEMYAYYAEKGCEILSLEDCMKNM